MNKPHYSFDSNYIEDNYLYSFQSIGVKGSILKLVIFQPIADNEYNLALLDYDQNNQIMDDTSISNNQDMPFVLATVINIVFDFFSNNPESLVFITGNTEIRQNLYNRVVRNNLNDLTELYIVKGVLKEGEIEVFSSLIKNYISIIVEKK
jgi:hypothetical protein